MVRRIPPSRQRQWLHFTVLGVTMLGSAAVLILEPAAWVEIVFWVFAGAVILGEVFLWPS